MVTDFLKCDYTDKENILSFLITFNIRFIYDSTKNGSFIIFEKCSNRKEYIVRFDFDHFDNLYNIARLT